jgi:hypothetical protein
MNTLYLNKSHFNKDNVYIGEADVTNCPDNIEIASDLGIVHFPKDLRSKGSIMTDSGTGISAGKGISADWGISAGYGISAGRGISAGYGISAGWGISAGYGISAGEGISAKQEIKVGKNYFVVAGANSWDNKEYEIRCVKLVSGTVKLGKLVLVPPEPTKQENNNSCDGKLVEIDGKKYKLTVV